MFTTGKCPGCGKVPFPRVYIEAVDIGVMMESRYKGVMYVCPNSACQTILGVEIDPIALKADTVDEVMKRLRKGK